MDWTQLGLLLLLHRLQSTTWAQMLESSSLETKPLTTDSMFPSWLQGDVKYIRACQRIIWISRMSQVKLGQLAGTFKGVTGCEVQNDSTKHRYVLVTAQSSESSRQRELLNSSWVCWRWSMICDTSVLQVCHGGMTFVTQHRQKFKGHRDGDYCIKGPSSIRANFIPCKRLKYIGKGVYTDQM